MTPEAPVKLGPQHRVLTGKRGIFQEVSEEPTSSFISCLPTRSGAQRAARGVVAFANFLLACFCFLFVSYGSSYFGSGSWNIIYHRALALLPTES